MSILIIFWSFQSRLEANKLNHSNIVVVNYLNLLTGRYIRSAEFTAHNFPFFARRDNLISLAPRACALEAKKSANHSR